MSTPFSGLGHIAGSSNNQYVTANSRFDDFDGMINGTVNVDADGASGGPPIEFTLTAAQYKFFRTRLYSAGAVLSADFVAKLPNQESLNEIHNDTAYVATIDTVAGAAQTIDIPPGGRRVIKQTAGNDLECVGTNLIEIAFFFGGTYADGARLVSHVVNIPFTLPAGLPASQAYAELQPTGNVTMAIQKNNVSQGTVDWTASTSAGAFTFAAAVSFAVGDRLGIVAPGTADATLGDCALTFEAVRTL